MILQALRQGTRNRFNSVRPLLSVTCHPIRSSIPNEVSIEATWGFHLDRPDESSTRQEADPQSSLAPFNIATCT